jgi:uncharacterized protein (TIGR03083 family)
MLTDERLATAIVAEANAFTDTFDGADLGLRVPTCPEWTLRQLVHHVGRAYYWASEIISSGATEMVPFEDVPDGELPADGHAEWVRAGAARLVAAVAEIGASTDVWTWTDDKRARFWLRRLTHETVVHRADATITVGKAFDVPVDLAVDGITEWLEIMTSSAAAYIAPNLAGTGQTLHFHGTDGGEWLIRRAPAGSTLTYEHVKADVAVRGAAADLLLVLTNRIPLADVEVFGDADLLAHWREHTKF